MSQLWRWLGWDNPTQGTFTHLDLQRSFSSSCLHPRCPGAATSSRGPVLALGRAEMHTGHCQGAAAMAEPTGTPGDTEGTGDN